MVLHAECLQPLVPETLHTTVVQVDVRDLYLRWEAISVDRKTVVVGGDLYLSGEQVFHRLVASPVAELQLVRSSSEGQAQ